MSNTAMSFESAEGQQLKRIIEERLSILRTQLESPTLQERETQEKRGAIAELRRMLQPAMPHLASPRYSGMDFKGE